MVGAARGEHRRAVRRSADGGGPDDQNRDGADGDGDGDVHDGAGRTAVLAGVLRLFQRLEHIAVFGVWFPRDAINHAVSGR
jgi:hypothetical protein